MSDALSITSCLLFLAGCSFMLHLFYIIGQLLPKVVVWPLPTTPCASATCVIRSSNWKAAACAASANQSQRKIAPVFQPIWEPNSHVDLHNCGHAAELEARLQEKGGWWETRSAPFHLLTLHPRWKSILWSKSCSKTTTAILDCTALISLPPSNRDCGQGTTDGFEGICLWKFPGSS